MFTEFAKNSLEILEARIAPATLAGPVYPTVKDAETNTDPSKHLFVSAQVGTPVLLKAGQLLTTGNGAKQGTYLMFVEAGQALVFTTDLNNNGQVDFNEITGIAAGDGLRLISFVDIHGDIVTNLDPDTTLSDSNNNSADDDISLKGDGRVLLNSKIDKIELRSLTIDDITDQNGTGTLDGTGKPVADADDVMERLALSSYSIHGNIYAGGGFGSATGGLIIDDAGRTLQASDFDGSLGVDYFINFKPTIGSIKTGSAASGEYFSFGISRANDTQGELLPYVPQPGTAGADIIGVRSANVALTFNINSLVAGDGGLGARGGNIQDVHLNGDNAGGYIVQAGNGGRGATGGAGGSIINFSDVGSVTSQVVIHSGSGGSGSTGAGGDGGNISFGTLNLSGGVAIELGNGGAGFTRGGNGASLSTAVITTPEGAVPYGLNVTTTTHDGPHDPATGKLLAHGVIGTHLRVDFDQDGFSDTVFTTADPNQLVVQFGNAAGGYRLKADGTYDRIYLDAPIGATGVTVGDFNGDGHQDIAVGSSDAGSFAGVTVFLNKFEDANVNGLTATEDLNHNGVDDFVGFRSGRQSVLPSLNSADPAAGGLGAYDYRRSANAITDIVAGDFNGDGYTELAVAATYYRPGLAPAQVLIFMQPDIEDGRPTGQFFADVGTKAQAEPAQGANPFVPFATINGVGGTKAVLEATALSDQSDHDVVVGTTVQGKTTNFLTIFDNATPSILGPSRSSLLLGTVDTNREVGRTAFTGAFAGDFTVHDYNGDGKADFTALTQTPAGFIVSLQGDGVGGGDITTASLTTSDNSGLYLGTAGFGLNTSQFAIRSGDFVKGTIGEEIGVLDYDARTPAIWTVDIFRLTGQPSTPSANPGGALSGIISSQFVGSADEKVVAFDMYQPVAGGQIGFGVAIPSTSEVGAHYIESSFGDITPLTENGIKMHAGNGGDALVGKGGNGGFIGGGIKEAASTDDQGGTILDLKGAISIELPTNIAYRGEVDIVGGHGGNGFSTGGNGGDVNGVSVRYATVGSSLHSAVFLYGGDGGIGVAGAGGAGGNLSANSIESGEGFFAGNGGAGLTGGAGGSIIGNGHAAYYDSYDLSMVLVAGHGGNGVRAGGAGGDIRNFHGSFAVGFTGAVGGLLSHTAGDGGTAVSGPGGRGGSVISSSPLTGANRLAGDILLQAGQGGHGKTGGDGGSVRDFYNAPSEQDSPAVLSILAGHGGSGISGKGGNGGNVINIDTPTKGQLDPYPEDQATVYNFNRILAGNGGKSPGGNGGNGGTVLNVTASNQDNPFVVVAGAGGAGLYAGGNGGSVVNSKINIGGTSFAKALVIAGAGGDATAWVANSLDAAALPNQEQRAFGGRVGRGGNGGSIDHFRQEGGISSRVDLIAGNGGSTVNYGTVGDSVSYVGKGGSIKNTYAQGDIGNIRSNIPIKAYNDISIGQSVADFVEDGLRNEVAPGSITDDVGNVGMVVGAAGRLKNTFQGYDSQNQAIYDSLAAAGGTNGSVIDLFARDIMSAVAGSVDRIAAIQAVQGIVVTNGGVVGALKAGDADYLDANGNPSPTPVIGGKLIDGALVYTSNPIRPGRPQDNVNLLQGRIFQIGGQGHA